MSSSPSRCFCPLYLSSHFSTVLFPSDPSVSLLRSSLRYSSRRPCSRSPQKSLNVPLHPGPGVFSWDRRSGDKMCVSTGGSFDLLSLRWLKGHVCREGRTDPDGRGFVDVCTSLSVRHVSCVHVSGPRWIRIGGMSTRGVRG